MGSTSTDTLTSAGGLDLARRDVYLMTAEVRDRRTLTIVEAADVPRDSPIQRAVERFAALVILVLLAPVFVAIAAAIRIHDGRPAIFRQVRTGPNATRFGMFKFRTMCREAESQQVDLVSDNVYPNGGLFKGARSDPRVTRVGRWLRRFSLDELPQLLNVLLGDMRFVGPRPTSAPAATMSDQYRKRLLCAARYHRPLAGQRPERPFVRGGRASGPPPRRKSIARRGLGDSGQDGPGRAFCARRLLSPAGAIDNRGKPNEKVQPTALGGQ